MRNRLLLRTLGAFLICGFSGVAAAETVEAGPIWNNGDANNKCPAVCGKRNEHWNGVWRTTIPNKMSVCNCEPIKPPPPPQANRVNKEAGPIWNNDDAKNKCPRLCAAPSKWDGQWWTTVPNKMSVCQCETPASKTCDKDAGPIWNNGDANGKCAKVCAAPLKWNGQWRTTVPNKMSTCTCEGCP